MRCSPVLSRAREVEEPEACPPQLSTVRMFHVITLARAGEALVRTSASPNMPM